MAEQVKKKERRAPQPEQRTFERNAKGVREMMSIKYDTFDFDGDWYQAFGRPEKRGVWLIWGQSGNGKTSFVMQLCKYLCQFQPRIHCCRNPPQDFLPIGHVRVIRHQRRANPRIYLRAPHPRQHRHHVLHIMQIRQRFLRQHLISLEAQAQAPRQVTCHSGLQVVANQRRFNSSHCRFASRCWLPTRAASSRPEQPRR